MSNEISAGGGIHHTQHVKALDGLRGYAAIVVTFFHAILHMDPTAVQRVLHPAIDQVAAGDLWLKIVLVFLDGGTAVSLFYVLSGTVLCQSLLRARLDWTSIFLFLFRRVFRLFPALFLCMLGMWGMSWVLHHFFSGFPLVIFSDAMLNALLIQTKIHGPSTSVQIEALATPFILLFAYAYKKYAVAAGIALFALSISAIQRNELVFFLPNMHVSVMVFFAGMLVALPEAQAIFSRITGWQLMGLIILAVVVRHLTHIQFLPGLLGQSFLLAAVVGFVRWASCRTFIHKFLEHRFSQFVGRISYSYYLLNIPVLWVLWFLPDLYALFTGFDQIWGGVISGVVATLITIPLAYLSYRFVELYFINLGAKISRSFGR